MAQNKSALNRLISRISIALMKSTSSWKQSTRTSVANILANIAWIALPKRRKITLRNLELCFPNWPEEKRREVAKSHFKYLLRAALDHSVLINGTKEEVQNYVKFEGKEQFLELVKEAPVIIITPHFVGLDAGGIAINTFYRGCSIYQPQSNPLWDKVFYDARKRFSDPVLIPKSRTAIKEVIRAIKSGLSCYYLPDMDHGRRNSIFVPFFGVPAATLPMVSKLARLTKVKVIWGIAETTETGYTMHLSAPLENFPTADSDADTLRVTQELEKYILKHPEQYLWSHRRFKTRPEGEPSVYENL